MLVRTKGTFSTGRRLDLTPHLKEVRVTGFDGGVKATIKTIER